jgi:hypothetical protein
LTSLSIQKLEKGGNQFKKSGIISAEAGKTGKNSIFSESIQFPLLTIDFDREYCYYPINPTEKQVLRRGENNEQFRLADHPHGAMSGLTSATPRAEEKAAHRPYLTIHYVTS